MEEECILLNTDTVININKESSNYRAEICTYYQKVSQILESYGMKSLSEERHKDDPKLTIYMNYGDVLLYDPDKNIPKYKDYKNYKKIRDDWYLYK